MPNLKKHLDRHTKCASLRLKTLIQLDKTQFLNELLELQSRAHLAQDRSHKWKSSGSKLSRYLEDLSHHNPTKRFVLL